MLLPSRLEDSINERKLIVKPVFSHWLCFYSCCSLCLLTTVASASSCLNRFSDVCVALMREHMFVFFAFLSCTKQRERLGGWCGLNIVDKRLPGTRLHGGQ